jgi:hypothetical protein
MRHRQDRMPAAFENRAIGLHASANQRSSNDARHRH